MLILGVQPKQICVTIEISVEELDSLLDVLEKSTVDYNKDKDPEFHKRMEFVTKVFVPTMDRLVEQYKNGT